jgi:DNA-binding NarL/FixJ family response regulator
VAAVPDVAVVDVLLPDGSGLDLCRVLGEIAPDVPVVVHSAVLTPAHTREAWAAGARAVIPKTIRTAALVDAVLDAARGRW